MAKRKLQTLARSGISCGIGLVLMLVSGAHAATPALDSRTTQELSEAIDAPVSISHSRATGAVSFLRVVSGSSANLAPTEGSLDQRARSFLSAQASLFGIGDVNAELVLKDLVTEPSGQNHMTYEQHYQGVPVFAGLLKAHFDQAGKLYAVNGNFVPEIDLDVSARISADSASRRAIEDVRVRNLRVDSTGISASVPYLVVYRQGLTQGVDGPSKLAWRIEVSNAGDIREFVFVDAHYGKVIDYLPGVHDALNRRTFVGTDGALPAFSPEAWPNSPDWVEGDAIPSGLQERDNMLIATADAHLRFMNAFGRDSYDGAGHVMDQAYNRDYGCPNASWNGNLISFCNGATRHDITAHEWGHAYTEYTHNLIYRWQSGALNESYSDMWGEAFDLHTTLVGMADLDTPNTRRTGACSGDPSVRWRLGEDVSLGGRDFWNPNCAGDPGKVTDVQYFCGTDDQGGVHTNSGVPNHAFALMVDGGTFNGQTIAAIGIVKAIHLIYRAQTVYQSAASNFADHADAMEMSCSDLVATVTSLTDPWGGSPETMQAADCTAVANAMLAVEMRTEPSACNFQPLLAQSPPAICTSGVTNTINLYDWESGADGWTVSRRGVVNPATFDARDWTIETGLPGGRSGSAFFAPNPVNGNCADDDESGALVLDSPPLMMPPGGTNLRITFDHYVTTEQGFDGGNLKISVDGGGYAVVPPSAYSYNQPSSAMEDPPGNTSPLAGEQGWHGTDGGSNSGTWGVTIGNLDGFVIPGQNFQLRFEFGSDGCNGSGFGWWVDDVQVYSCDDEGSIYADGFESP